MGDHGSHLRNIPPKVGISWGISQFPLLTSWHCQPDWQVNQGGSGSLAQRQSVADVISWRPSDWLAQECWMPKGYRWALKVSAATSILVFWIQPRLTRDQMWETSLGFYMTTQSFLLTTCFPWSCWPHSILWQQPSTKMTAQSRMSYWMSPLPHLPIITRPGILAQKNSLLSHLSQGVILRESNLRQLKKKIYIYIYSLV